VAAVITVIAGLSLGSWARALLPLLAVPAAVALWAWRSGTDVTPAGLTVRAAFGSRHVAWNDLYQIAPDSRGRVVAHLASGTAQTLPAVSPRDLPLLAAASPSPGPDQSAREPAREASRPAQ
jgi:hypothetical protein